MIKPIFLAVLFVFGLTLTTAAQAADIKEDAIQARRGYYQIIKLNMGVMVAMVKGEADYDAAKAKIAADNLVTLTKLNTDTFWVPGTSKSDMPGKTRALQKIWDTYPAVKEKGKAYKEAVMAAAEVAGGGLDGLRQAVPNLGKTCKACHDEYRADKF